MYYSNHYKSPIGGMTMCSDGNALTGLWFDGAKYFGSTLENGTQEKDLLIFAQTKKWLDIYFTGKNPDFMPDISLSDSEFRLFVWKMLMQIPYGKLITYKEIADTYAKEKGLKLMSAQAVGNAVSHNPISIIIPCHRVISKNGNLTGYAGGLDRKKFLLNMENVLLTKCGV